jgi:hypothetical protein
MHVFGNCAPSQCFCYKFQFYLYLQYWFPLNGVFLKVEIIIVEKINVEMRKILLYANITKVLIVMTVYSTLHSQIN